MQVDSSTKLRDLLAEYRLSHEVNINHVIHNGADIYGRAVQSLAALHINDNDVLHVVSASLSAPTVPRSQVSRSRTVPSQDVQATRGRASPEHHELLSSLVRSSNYQTELLSRLTTQTSRNGANNNHETAADAIIPCLNLLMRFVSDIIKD